MHCFLSFLYSTLVIMVNVNCRLWFSNCTGYNVVSFLNKASSVRCNCQQFKGYHVPQHHKKLNGIYDYENYQPFEKIEKELFRITKKSDSSEVFSIGKTFENRSLWAIKTHVLQFRKKFYNASQLTRQTIVVDCGAHAREWIAPSTCMFLIKKFSEAVDSILKTKLADALQKFDWVFIPLLNPDGYVYSWHNKTTRLWRKNRSFTKEQIKLKATTNNELCIGVDINRNFDKSWGGIGAPVVNPCYEMYAGPNAFSENESSALAEYLNSSKYDIIAYVSLHNFGQNWMTPWGFTKKLPTNYKEMMRVANLAVEAMKKYSGIQYSAGSSYQNLYPNSGNSADWAYDVANIPYSYTVEMMPKVKGKGKSSFLVPPHCMIRNAKDILVGLIAMADGIKP